jgi:hypothetical protein
MPGGALACVLPPRTRHAWPSLEAGHSVRGPACVGSHGATRGSHKGRGTRQNAEMALASSGYAAEHSMDPAFVAG